MEGLEWECPGSLPCLPWLFLVLLASVQVVASTVLVTGNKATQGYGPNFLKRQLLCLQGSETLWVAFFCVQNAVQEAAPFTLTLFTMFWKLLLD